MATETSVMSSDGEDDLIERLRSSLFHIYDHNQRQDNCSCCASPNARIPCPQCYTVYYCNETCKIRGYSEHRQVCLSGTVPIVVFHALYPHIAPVVRCGNEKSASENGDNESESGNTDSFISTTSILSEKAHNRSRASSNAYTLDTQLFRLIALLKKAPKNGSMKHLEAPIAQLKEQLRVLEGKPVENKKETREVVKSRAPLLVKDDYQFRKYFKLKDLDMPLDRIKEKMVSEGVDPSYIEKPYALSPNDEKFQRKGAFMRADQDPLLRKYYKLKHLGISDDLVKRKMESEQVDPKLLDHPDWASPNACS